MLRKRLPPILLAIAVTGICASCNSPLREQVRAAKLESQGKFADALHIYQAALPRVPRANNRQISQLYVHMGECLWRLGRPSEALAAFQQAVETDTSNLIAHVKIGTMYLAGGAPGNAREQANFVLQRADNNSDAWALLGASSAANGDDGIAKWAYTRVLASEPKRVSVAVALAELYDREGEEDMARSILRSAADAEHSSATPLLALGRLEEEVGNPKAAEQDYREAVEREDTPETNLRLAQFLQRGTRIAEAEHVLRHVDSMQPALPTAVPDFELISGRAPVAVDRYQAVLRSSTSQPQTKGKQQREGIEAKGAVAARMVEADLALARQDAGTSEVQGHELALAVRRAQRDLEQYRGDLDGATFAVLQAEIALTDNDLAAANHEADEAVKLAPQSAAAHYVRGAVRLRSGDPAAARMEWESALERDNSCVPARLALATQSLQGGDAVAAETYVIQVVRDEPANVEGLTLFAHTLAQRKHYQEAEQVARRAVAVDPKNAAPHLLLGELAIKQNRAADALKEYERAVLLDPQSQPALDAVIGLYRRAEVTRPMLQRLEGVALEEPPSPTLLEIAGRLYAEHHWFEDASRCLHRALALDPHRTTAAAALAQLQAAQGELTAAADSAMRTDNAAAALLAGGQAQDRNDVAGAVKQYQEAVKRGDRTGIAANNLAWLYAMQGAQLDRALQLAQEAHNLSPHSPAILDTLGFVYLRRREYSQAVQQLELAAHMATASDNDEHDPHLLAQIREHLAEAYRRAGQPQSAQLQLVRIKTGS